MLNYGKCRDCFCNSWIGRQSTFLLKPAKAAANGKRPGGKQKRDLLTPKRALHSAGNVRWNAAQQELSVIIFRCIRGEAEAARRSAAST